MSDNGDIMPMPDRLPNGQFAPGNSLCKGYQFHREVQKFRARLLKCVTEEDFEAVCEKLLNMAKNGERWAIAMLFDRLLGKPTEHIDLNTNDSAGFTFKFIRVDAPPSVDGDDPADADHE